MSNSLRPHELQHTRPPCPSPTPGVHPNPCPLSQWCHPTISSSVIPFSCPQSFPASGSFPMSQLFTWGGQSTGVSASKSVLPMNTQDWSPLGWWIFFPFSYKFYCWQSYLKTNKHVNKSGRERQILYDITYMWNPKHTTNKCNKKETDSQTRRKKCKATSVEREGEKGNAGVRD